MTMDLIMQQPMLAWLPILLPLAAAAAGTLAGLLGRPVPERWIHALTSGVLGAAAAATALLAFQLARGGPFTCGTGVWFDVDGLAMPLDLQVDAASLAMLGTTLLVMTAVVRFSRNYLHRDPGFLRFYTTLQLACGGLSVFWLAGSLELAFAGWELLGIASALLVGFFQERSAPVRHALRVFITYRVADVGLLGAGVLLHTRHVSTSFAAWTDVAASAPAGLMTMAGLLLLLAASGKSAQLPFSNWLPRAMEGPTPSSALFYGALSVHAGAYLLLRASPLLAASPAASAAVVAVGVATMVHAWLVLPTQTDIKSRLAYATLTHLGLIFAMVGVGWTGAATVWMVAHALLRAAQLLRAPSALAEFEVTRDTGGSRNRGPVWLYRAALERFYLDALQDRWVVRPVLGLARALDWLDRRLSGRPSGVAIAPPERSAAEAAGDLAPASPGWQVAGLGCLAAAGWILAPALGTAAQAGPSAGLAGLLAGPLVAAACMPFARDRATALRWHTAASVVVLGTVLGAGWWMVGRQEALLLLQPTPWGEVRLRLDMLALVGVVLSQLVLTASAIASPRSRTTRRDLMQIHLLQGGYVLVLTADQLPVLAIATGLTALPLLAMARRHATGREDRWWFRGIALQQGVSVGSLGVALGLAGPAVWGGSLGLPGEALASPVILCLGLAAWSRSAMVPFHGWVTGALERMPAAACIPALLSPVGLVLFARLVLPALYAPGADMALGLVLGVATFHAVAAVLLSLVQPGLRRSLAMVVVADAALPMLALGGQATHALHGGLLLLMANTLSLTALLLVATAVTKRLGGDTAAARGGLTHGAPMLSAWFLVSALFAFGAPGSAAFVATEWILQGSWHTHPGVALGFALTQGLASMSLWRLWTLHFLGPAPHDGGGQPAGPGRPGRDALVRERAGLLLVVVLGLLLGLMPGFSLHLDHPVVEQLLPGPAADGHHGAPPAH